ncbi:MAG: hypothetical protein LRY73_07305 [Bacillus sp. (in: Bacteria)]|nr:hypothetical protein [Bacillus sp. (in: firmicutes)]
MKIFKSMPLLLLIFIVFASLNIPFTSLANSGPTYWYHHPSSDVLVIDENSPIEVHREDLLFDFSNSENFAHTINGNISATYAMYNPTDTTQSVQMVFPFVSHLNAFSADTISILVDGSEIDFELFLGGVVNNYGGMDQEVNYDFATILSTITTLPYEAKHFSPEEMGILHEIQIESKPGEQIKVAIDFAIDEEKTKVFSKGFNGYGYDNGKIDVSTWCFDDQCTLHLFALGEDIDYTVLAFSEDGPDQQTESDGYTISKEEIMVKEYLQLFMEENSEGRYSNVMAPNQLYNIFARALDESFEYMGGFSSDFELLEKQYYERIFSVVYTVEFPPETMQEVSVQYEAAGTMDQTQTAMPLYTIEYILNPANNWSSFEDLHITIKTPDEAPFIVESNFELEEVGNQEYYGFFPKLPEKDLSFSLYGDRTVTVLDRFGGSLNNRYGYYVPYLVGATLLFVTIGGIAGTVLWGKRRKS